MDQFAALSRRHIQSPVGEALARLLKRRGDVTGVATEGQPSCRLRTVSLCEVPWSCRYPLAQHTLQLGEASGHLCIKFSVVSARTCTSEQPDVLSAPSQDLSTAHEESRGPQLHSRTRVLPQPPKSRLIKQMCTPLVCAVDLAPHAWIGQTARTSPPPSPPLPSACTLKRKEKN